MTKSANLGFPRIGAKRELKFAVESFWRGETGAEALEAAAAGLRDTHWKLQAEAGADIVPTGDFSLYDQVLDMAVLLGAVPARFSALEGLARYFAMARGADGVPAMEMTKWFDTNYHYIVPELAADQAFALSGDAPVRQYREARALGLNARPVVIGPVTFLSLSKPAEGADFDPVSLIEAVLPAYEALLASLRDAGAEWVQIDEPVLATDLSQAQRAAFETAYERLSRTGPRLMLTSYFGPLADNLDLAILAGTAGLHLDLVRGAGDLDPALERLRPGQRLSLGVVDGRNVWRTDLDRAYSPVRRAAEALGPDRIEIAPSCSLLHSPVDLDREDGLDDELKSWLAFAVQKLGEVKALALAAAGDPGSAPAFGDSRAAAASRRASPRLNDPAVRRRLAETGPGHHRRRSAYPERRPAQARRLGLPAFPTTTIGSFPQTAEVRQARAANRRGEMDDAAYDAFLKDETRRTIALQERLGLDMLVHGEYERTDMVEHFGQLLEGFAFTRHGWVQSYGSRCVKPPLIYGDVSRPKAMTVAWARFAQGCSDRPVKGMLTGPVTILQWSFVRDDQPRDETCRQIALAIRDEVADLEAAGIAAIQIDEPALREGLPLRRDGHKAYLDQAVACFRLSAAVVADETQIHTHMCYSEFNEIIEAIAALDADVISVEASRSRMELLDAFVDFDFPNEIGPGVWDIHSPRVPSAEEMAELLAKAAERLDPARLWVNPDCGLKTRGWPEVEAAIANMVAAAKALRRARKAA